MPTVLNRVTCINFQIILELFNYLFDFKDNILEGS
jgi:hypothetical protein